MDAARGFSVASMVAFHFCYDLRFIAGMSLDWFAPPLQDIWRASISWTFLAIAGFMCSVSRNNLKRGAVYATVAAAVFVVTSVVSVDAPISFGVIFCMAASTLVAAALERLDLVPKGPVAAIVLAALFLLTLHVPQGTIGIGPVSLALPRALYATEWLSWLGFPGPHFISGDYYPLIPHTLLFLAGAAIGYWLRESNGGYPRWMYDIGCAPLELVGRHALLIYALHQPVLLLLAGAL